MIVAGKNRGDSSPLGRPGGGTCNPALGQLSQDAQAWLVSPPYQDCGRASWEVIGTQSTQYILSIGCDCLCRVNM